MKITFLKKAIERSEKLVIKDVEEIIVIVEKIDKI